MTTALGAAVFVVVAGCSSAGTSVGTSLGTSVGTSTGPPMADGTGDHSTAASPIRSRKLDLQAHRGGAGERTENSIASFTHAIELGVTTLELDTQITKDGKVVVTHDNTINPDVCAETAPATKNDPQYPYVGKVVHDLTLAQLLTLDCGFQQRPGMPEQQATKGSRIPELQEVFALVKAHRATVMMNIETKIDATAREQSAPVDEFVGLLHDQITASGLADQVTIQSFDWSSLQAMHRLDPTVPLVALTTTANTQMDLPGASPWLGGLDIDDYDRDVVKAAHAIDGVTAVSPAVVDVTPGMVQEAHALGLTVIPWTVDDPDQMQQLIDIGVDGIITNYPTRLRTVMADNKLPLPPAFPA
ncbi:glycerophosphodiester phosphodiesterase family protein [Nakamurella lactea]|uniref:glycerophosphodiester phosphodiesterase family protein n=1 Tax=Nakamurella lactea TaxID=459515 RepID=UPI000426175D|nr:glycerophosphodiester phosphodiesterase family protein [Nakamurella lactea]